MNIEQLSLFKQKVLDGSLEICKGKVTPTQIYELANKALEEALTIHSVVGQSEQFKCLNVACDKMINRSNGKYFCKKHRRKLGI